MKIFEAQVRVPNGSGTTVVKTRVMAENTYSAKLLLEQQYGAKNIVSSPRQVN